MLNPGPKRDSLAAKLLLSSALVAVSLAYGWWQRHDTGTPVLATAPMPSRPAPGQVASLPGEPATAPPAPMAQAAPATQDADTGVKDAPAKEPASPAAAAPTNDAPSKPAAIAKAAPQAVAPVAPEAPPNPAASSPASPPTLTTQQAMQMNQPTGGPLPALPWVTGNPDQGAIVSVPAGQHLQDGEYVSNRHELMWGDVKLKISIHGGSIVGVQMLDFPDHRSQSLYLSQMALPVLESEVIKSQKAQVDTVSSATDTSYTFQDAITEVIASAIRE
jgi:uncharacterized protein with FMN-binding domain